MDIDENLLTFLLADPTIADMTDVVVLGDIPDDDNKQPYIWVSLSDEEDELDMDGIGGLAESRFDIEACSTDIDRAKQLGKAVKKRLDGYAGSFGDTQVQGVFVESKDDEYLPINANSDDSLIVIAMDIRIDHAGD